MKKHFRSQTQMLESVWAKFIGVDNMMGRSGIARRVIRLTGAIFILLSLCIFFQLAQQPTNAFNIIQFMQVTICYMFGHSGSTLRKSFSFK